jgi:pyrroline-5-carboxylate reductase
MTNKSIGFIGGGRVTKIILHGWKRAEILPGKIIVTDTSAEPLQKLKIDIHNMELVVGNAAIPAACDIVVLSLHPPAVPGVLQEIKSSLQRTAIVVSLAPKLSIAKISEALGGFTNIIRMNPNAPSIVNAGYNPLVFSGTMNSADRKTILDLFQPLGDCPEVTEELLEAYAITTAMGPTYMWFQLYELQELAKSFGIFPQPLAEAIPKMLLGAVKTMYESGLTPAEVMDLVPVKPLLDEEETIKGFYRNKLSALYNKLKS